MVTWKQTARCSAVIVTGLLLLPAMALAAQSSSPNYQVNEVFFGAGGELDASSPNYQSKESIGETAVGNTASPGYQAQAGFNTNRDPYIQFTVNSTDIDLGTLTPNSTKTATASFSVEAYLSHGYSVVNASDPPSNNDYTMKAITTPSLSAVGTEQFGINLVQNTPPNAPSTFGNNPQYLPDATFSHGQVAADYNQNGYFKYVNGDVVALSTASSSATTYTVSYLFNVSNITPGGTYTFHHVLVATATY
jgi:hypothetical protein